MREKGERVIGFTTEELLALKKVGRKQIEEDKRKKEEQERQMRLR